jgi:asparagine synthase (glutamine-hydrolysing)
MCGIAGFVSIDGLPLDPSRSTIQRMTDIIVHRGPDSEGHHVESLVHLGARRLSIQDIAGGKQPVDNEDGTVTVVFNGEIYNFKELREELLQRGHQLKSKSDTEILPHLYEEYGLDFVNRLNGQFAIALWDSVRRKLLLVRDRVGKKPLFYAIRRGVLVFGSEIKSILLHPAVERRVDPRCLDTLFTFLMPVNPRTMFEGINNLPPGRMLEVQGGDVKVIKYWELPLPDLSTVPKATDEEWIERIRDALKRSVRYRLISDVPIGVFLSGGLDSSVIAALVSEMSSGPVQTYSMVHEDDAYDEREYSDAVAERLGTDHHRVVITAAEIAQRLPQLVWCVEAPSLKTSNAAYLKLYKAAKDRSTVILTGEGADEALGGYPNIRMLKVLDFYRRHPNLPGARKLMDREIPPGTAVRVTYYEPNELDPEERARVLERYGCVPADLQRFRANTKLKERLFSRELRAQIGEFSAESDFASSLVNTELLRGKSPTQQSQYFEYLLKLPNFLLINSGDRPAMANSVENRCPFIDYEFVELCMKLPLNLRVRGLNEKYVLKRAFETALPAKVLKRKKRGFSTFFVSSVYRKGRPEYLDDALSERAVRAAGMFEYSEVAAMKKALDDPDLSKEKQLALEPSFALVVTAQLWHQQFIERFDPSGPGVS